MNKLSWMLYWADTLPSLATFICIVSFFGFAASLALYMLGVTRFGGDADDTRTVGYGKDEHEVLRNPGLQKTADNFTKAWPLVILCFLVWGASFLVPSKDTFYMIAASEAGEQALAAPEVGKVRLVLNKWLDGQLKDSPRKK